MNFETVERNVPRRTSLKTLKERKDEMIRDGEITVGEKIVSIEHEIIRIDPEGNSNIIFKTLKLFQLVGISAYFLIPFQNCNIMTKMTLFYEIIDY